MDPRSAYREGAVRGASGVRLIIFLYEQAIQDLRRAAVAMEQGNIEMRTLQINHAISVIGHLQGTLDRERGGRVGRDLERFYRSMRGRLIDAQALASSEILYQQISDLLSVRESWIEVDRVTQTISPHQPVDASADRETFTATLNTFADGKY